MSPEQRREYVKQLVDKMPPLTPEQRADLRVLLRPGVIAARAAKLAEMRAAA